MSPSRRKSVQRRRTDGGKQKPVELWQPRPPLPPLEPAEVSPDPTALLRSLGPPPIHADAAEHYLAAVAARAAVLARALGVSAGVLIEPGDDVELA
ncbi:MAG TPA: hypothetical protein VM345_12880 [Acidimicrobiales bacterium]|nr:hypothetical protein [Acidimicrobiales bacterium]